MILSLLFLLSAADCVKPRADDRVLLVIESLDPALSVHEDEVERAVRGAAAGKIQLLGKNSTLEAITSEGGREERERAVVEARVVIDRAEEKFRLLEDNEALDLLSKAITRLSTVHHAPGAIELLARAHLVSGAIFLARGRTEAARQRLQRALDLEPDLSPPRERFAQELLAELAGVRAAAAAESRAAGRLEVTSGDVKAEVYIDGRRSGETPLVLDALGAGNHLLRVYAPGYSSSVGSIQVGPNAEVKERVVLTRDAELEAISGLVTVLKKREDPAALLSLLSKRAGADRTLLATARLADESTSAGTATVAVELRLERGGTAFARRIDRASLSAAVDRALACEADAVAVGALAPMLIGEMDARFSEPRPVPAPIPIWDEPWFWGAIFLGAIAAGSAAVFLRAAGGPPEAVEVTLIPRP